jgi:hypothetical protein
VIDASVASRIGRSAAAGGFRLLVEPHNRCDRAVCFTETSTLGCARERSAGGPAGRRSGGSGRGGRLVTGRPNVGGNVPRRSRTTMSRSRGPPRGDGCETRGEQGAEGGTG